jgi:hypothetical protein
MRCLHVGVLCLSLLSVTKAARAQQAPAATVTVGFTLMSDDFGREIKQAMLNPDLPTPMLSGNSTSKIHVYAEAHVRRGKTRSIGILFGGENGYTSLTGDPTSLDRLDLRASFEVQTFGVLYSKWLGSYVRVGAGPAIHSTRVRLSASPGPVSPPHHKQSLGWVAGATLNLPNHRRPNEAFEITIQRRHVSDFELAPQLLPRGFDYSRNVERSPFQWPRMKVSPSHWMLGVSMGLRF